MVGKCLHLPQSGCILLTAAPGRLRVRTAAPVFSWWIDPASSSQQNPFIESLSSSMGDRTR